MLYEQFKNGINIGGWLSQYNCLIESPENNEQMKFHLKNYIKEKNIAQIASWGLDHIRIPIDYRVLVETKESLTDSKTALRYLAQCIDWCEKYHLNVIIDLHDAEGNVYEMMDKPMPLLTDEKLKQNFLNIWKMLAEHFKEKRTPVLMFELLNEASDGSGYLWNELYKEAVQVIREIDSERYILVGSNEQNSPFRLKELELLDEEKVFYNFHFYDPQVFTHQQAHFSPEMKMFDRKVHYPDKISDFTEFLSKNREYLPKYRHVAMEKEVSQESMKELLKDALDFVKYSGKELYCGEFGVIDVADTEDAAGWINDVKAILDEYKIGHAIWNYKELDFGFVDSNDEIKLQARQEKVFRI